MEIISLLNSNDIIEIEFDNFNAYYNLNNGKTISIEKKYLNYKSLFFQKNNFYKQDIINCNYSKIIIGINISSVCNLRCKYCFNEKKESKKLNIEYIKNFIKYIVNTKKEADKYFVDLAGSGEPLLYLKDIVEIANFCKEISDDVGKEVTPMLSTNGILLTKNVVDILQNKGVLFGVSLDGYKELHNKYRIDINNNLTYDIIYNNVIQIQNNDYVGGSMTIVDENTDIFKAYLEMSKIFKTIAIRPCRMSYENFSFNYIIDGYDKFVELLIEEVVNKRYELLCKIINGDDFFGKTIIKIVSNSKLNRRCDAGIARFSLGVDGKIYPCSPASYHQELEIIKDNIEKGINNDFFNVYPKKCENCIAKNACGSDCYVQLFESSKNESLCEFKKKLFILAIYFCCKVEISNFDAYCKVVNLVNDIIKRNRVDEELRKLYLKCSHIYSFTELKRIKDSNSTKYKKLYDQFCLDKY